MKSNHIHCVECRYAVIDKGTSIYSKKQCSICDNHIGCKIKKTKSICEKQTLKWVAVQCACPASEYHMALLNVTLDGNMLQWIAWPGCESGAERRDAV